VGRNLIHFHRFDYFFSLLISAFCMRLLLALLALGLSVLVACTFWYQRALRPIDPLSNVRVTITIEEGMSVADIAERLQERELIRSPFAFKMYTRFAGRESQLQAGSFVIRQSLSLREIVDVLSTGKAAEMILTIPEGFTVSDIDSLLAEKELITAGEFVTCAQTCDVSAYWFLPDDVENLADRGGKVEGYLYPDTYFVVAEGFTAEVFLNRLLATFELRVVEQFPEQLARSDISLHQAITMASLIEEEASDDAERPVIAGILWKRYNAGLGLGVDASVRYILDKPTDEITIADLNTNSLYNTRKFKGLPPGPIANPGYESILAAFHPQETEYWYYLHDRNGDIHYAVTNEEHNVNRNTYLQ